MDRFEPMPQFVDQPPNIDKPKHSKYDQVLIERGGGISLLPMVLNAQPVKERLVSGVRRIEKTRAESIFTTYIKEDELYISQLFFGTRAAESLVDIRNGLSPRVAFVSTDIGFCPQYSGLTPRLLVAIHFHPDFSGFSDQDINVHEQRSVRAAKYSKDFRVHYAPQDKNLPFYDGVVACKWSASQTPTLKRELSLKSATLERAVLLLFGGTPTSNLYQAEQFDRLSFADQEKLLKESGFEVITQEVDFK